MSKAIKDLFFEAKNNSELRARLVPIMEALADHQSLRSSEGSTWGKLVDLAGSMGYVCSREDLDCYLAEMSSELFKASLAGELTVSETDLEVLPNDGKIIGSSDIMGHSS